MTPPVITIDVVAVDDIINAIEDDSPVTISGTADIQNGRTVMVVLNGTTYTPIVNDDVWSFDISAAEAQALDATETITADVSDLSGNPAIQAMRDIEHDVSIPTIAIDLVAGDDIINTLEDDSPVAISGTTDAEDGQTVTLTLNGQTYTTTVTGGTWSVNVPAMDAQGLNAAETIFADVFNSVGNPAVQAARDIEHDVTVPIITIDVVAADDIINALEDDSPVTLSGTTDAEDGQTVTVFLNDNTYTTAVTGGTWSLDLPAADAQALNPTETIFADVSDTSGNPAVQATRDIRHDDTAPTINIDIVAADDIINAMEDNSPVSISGTTDAENGQTVTVVLNGNTYTTTVTDGTWSVDIPAVDAQALNANETLTADVSDFAGNPAVQTSRPIAYDPIAPNVPIVTGIGDDTNIDDDAVTSDSSLNFIGVAEPNATVEVFIDGVGIGTTTADASGNFTFDHQATDLPDGPYTVTVVATDAAGNPSIPSNEFPIVVDTANPSVDSFSTQDTSPIVTGQGDPNESLTVQIDADGDGTIDVTYTVTTDTNGDWSLDTEMAVPDTGSLPTLQDGDVLEISAIDTAGNLSIGTIGITVDSDNDGLNDLEEEALGTDPNNADSDGDGVNDGQEVADNTDPLQDCDSVNGSPLPASDCDADGLGNDMEANLGTDPNNADTDGDGLTDGEEVNLGTDPVTADSDGDGITDGQEVTNGTNPLDDCDSNGGTALETSDCDDDGLTNAEENGRGTDPFNADTDGDGISDSREINDGTNPTDACSSNGGTTPDGIACDITIETDLIGPGINGGIFKITNIESYTNNTVRIYNRWGVLVYETKGYDNAGNAFRGISNGRVTISQSDELPVGVYYYIIDYMEESQQEARTKNGYLYVTR